ncbi:MAG: hypothetical protein S4CHLAM81_01340 [Chlamydiales bacterium]|nr:hypothetical protein [Chlamydiales bacterium]MCH9634930.1 hypothetical protein [Chlamydiales bacterium]MCH9703536.1 hypothetical protein [Chlamydiota bacterium]
MAAICGLGASNRYRIPCTTGSAVVALAAVAIAIYGASVLTSGRSYNPGIGLVAGGGAAALLALTTLGSCCCAGGRRGMPQSRRVIDLFSDPQPAGHPDYAILNPTYYGRPPAVNPAFRQSQARFTTAIPGMPAYPMTAGCGQAVGMPQHYPAVGMPGQPPTRPAAIPGMPVQPRTTGQWN